MRFAVYRLKQTFLHGATVSLKLAGELEFTIYELRNRMIVTWDLNIWPFCLVFVIPTLFAAKK